MDAKNYEFSYLLSPSISNEEILTYAGKISTLIEEAGGALRRVEEPRKIILAYPISKQKNGYFGWTTFGLAPEMIVNFKKKLKEQNYFLRYLLVEEEIEKYPALIRPLPMRRQTPPRPKVQVKRDEVKPEEKLDLEALDKKLEEILGK